MALCLIKTSEYRTKLALSGISEFKFYSFANAFSAKHGRLPNLDEIPNANSSNYVKDLIHINEDNTAKIDDILSVTDSSSIEEANIKLNDLFSDLEIRLFPLNELAIVNILRKPSEYKQNDEIESVRDRFVNTRTLFTGIFNKLNDLYGILLIPINNLTLSKLEWDKVPEVRNSTAFIYNNNVYINTDNADIDAPIHELTHMLLGSIRFKNPDLYFDLVLQAELFNSFGRIAGLNPNKTVSDILEETFVSEVAKYLSGLSSDLDNLDTLILYEINYNIKKLLDSVLMGTYSVKSINDSRLFNSSISDIVANVQSNILENKISGSMDDAALHRMLSNKKSELMKKGDLREDCK